MTPNAELWLVICIYRQLFEEHCVSVLRSSLQKQFFMHFLKSNAHNALSGMFFKPSSNQKTLAHRSQSPGKISFGSWSSVDYEKCASCSKGLTVTEKNLLIPHSAYLITILETLLLRGACSPEYRVHVCGALRETLCKLTGGCVESLLP